MEDQVELQESYQDRGNRRRINEITQWMALDRGPSDLVSVLIRIDEAFPKATFREVCAAFMMVVIMMGDHDSN
jgi:hypothetical protein